jgi:flavin-dependent dehydrogenase
MMNKISHLAIVGAGPAGASAAIRLAQKGFRIILIERERFPRQKLCGEFISPECFRHFRALGVFEEMLAAGGERIVETAFYAANGKRVGVPSKWFNDEGGALSLSRAEMDFRLLERAKSLGVEILEEFSVVNLSYEKDEIRAVNLRARDGGAKEIFADLFVDATGRARVLGKLAEKQRFQIRSPKSEIPSRLVGLRRISRTSVSNEACARFIFFAAATAV